MKQQKIYVEAAKENPKIDGQLAASGHFEFGNKRQIVEMNDTNYSEKVKQLWKKGNEIEGWSHYWNGLYTAIIKLKQKSTQLNQAIMLVKYEDLCNQSMTTIDQILDHCNLNMDKFTEIKKDYNQQLSLPEYYNIPYHSHEINEILTITQTVSENFGYNADNYN
jgi:hypothetical protein